MNTRGAEWEQFGGGVADADTLRQTQELRVDVADPAGG